MLWTAFDTLFGISISATATDANSIEEQGPQILGVIQVVRRLIENLPVLLLSHQGDFYRLLNDVTKLTTICLRGTVEDVDQGWISEAFDECLATWVSLGMYFHHRVGWNIFVGNYRC
jgi:hypothetical protein